MKVNITRLTDDEVKKFTDAWPTVSQILPLIRKATINRGDQTGVINALTLGNELQTQSEGEVKREVRQFVKSPTTNLHQKQVDGLAAKNKSAAEGDKKSTDTSDEARKLLESQGGNK